MENDKRYTEYPDPNDTSGQTRSVEEFREKLNRKQRRRDQAILRKFLKSKKVKVKKK